MTLGGTTVVSITAGTMLRTTAAFSDLLTGQLVSPDTVLAGYQLGTSSPVDAGDAMVNDEEGLYHWDIDTAGFALPQKVVLMVLYWQGSGEVDVTSDPAVVRVVGPSFSLG